LHAEWIFLPVLQRVQGRKIVYSYAAFVRVSVQAIGLLQSVRCVVGAGKLWEAAEDIRTASGDRDTYRTILALQQKFEKPPIAHHYRPPSNGRLVAT
jgi:hypothetical protein